METTGIKISIDTEAVKITRSVILEILNTKADQETIRVALSCLEKACSIGNVHIQDTVVSMIKPAEGKRR